jgi:putative FmdB family regulatory protein
MPIYEYRCDACAEEFERLVFSGDKAAPECPQCGSAKTQRLMSCFSSSGEGKSPFAEAAGGAASCGGSTGFT